MKATIHLKEEREARKILERLAWLADCGDSQAAFSVLKIAYAAIETLGKMDVGDLPARSHGWPVALSAIQEKRRDELKRWEALGVGSALGIKTHGKNRKFDRGQYGELGVELYGMIEPVRRRGAEILAYLKRHPEAIPNWRDAAARLDKLNAANLDEWVGVATAAYKELCMGDLTMIPLPECAEKRVAASKRGKGTDGNGSPRGVESALKEQIKAGLNSLIV